MSDVFWMGFFSLCTAALAACLAYVFNERTATRQTARSEQHSAQEWERSESRRKAQETRADAHRQEDFQRSDARHRQEVERQEAHRREEIDAARLRECWENVLASSERVKRLSQIYGSGREPSAQEEPSVYSAQACSVALLGLKTVYPLAKAFHEATVLLQINAREVGFPAVPLSLHAWGQSLEALEEEIARQTGVAPVAGDAVSDDATTASSPSTKAD